MATRAEMEAELAVLRRKMSRLDEAEEDADPKAPTAGSEPPPLPEEPSESKTSSPEISGVDDVKSEIERVFAAHGVSTEDIDALAQQLWDELDTLPQNKPLVTAIGAFVLGFLLGRITK